MSGFTSNANLTGYRYGNVGTVGEQFPNVPIQAAVTGAQTVTLNLFSNTSTVYNPTILPGEVFVSLNQLASTTTVYNPTILPGVVTINFDRLESTTTVYNPTVIQPGGAQTILLDLLTSTTQVFNPTIVAETLVTDTSDILSRGLKKRKYRLTKREEEEIAAQILKQRQAPKIAARQTQLDWKQLIADAINEVTSIEELNTLTIPTDGLTSPSSAAAILQEVEKQKELKRIQLEIAQFELALKQADIEDAIQEQRQLIENAKQLQQDVLARYKIAEDQAMKDELASYQEMLKAEQDYLEFKRKRDNKIKRLKALMWLAKLDL